jgi:hypothetical protein
MEMFKVSKQEYDWIVKNYPNGNYRSNGDSYEVSEDLHEAWFDYIMTCYEEAHQEDF